MKHMSKLTRLARVRRMRGASTVKLFVLILVVLILLPILVVGFFEGRKAYWDYRVREMCAIDGGIKVYETVKLPAEKFDQYGNVRIPSKANAKSEDEYYREWNIQYYRQGNPELSKDHFKIIRRSDGRLLGEAIYYGRGGGDIPGPWHDSSFRCPDTANQPSLESSIFVKGE